MSKAKRVSAARRSSKCRPDVYFRHRPLIEALEERRLLATVDWISPVSGDWNVGSNWSTGQVPGTSDDAVIDTAATLSVVIPSGDNESVHSLTTTANDTLAISGNLTLDAN